MGVPASKRNVLKRELVKYLGTGSLSDTDAEKYGPELLRIAGRHGLAEPEVLVKEAKNKAAYPALHDWIYDCSDTEAAYQHRLERAAYLVRHVVVIEEHNGEPVQIRPFINVEEDEQRGYCDHHRIGQVRERDMREDQAFDLLRSFVRRFADLTSVAPATKIIRRLLKLRDEEG